MTTRHVVYDEDGNLIAATCVDQPLRAEAAGHLAAVVRAAFLLEHERDPDNLLGDKQVRAVNRIRGRTTPRCPHDGCDRIDGHEGRCVPDTPPQEQR